MRGQAYRIDTGEAHETGKTRKDSDKGLETVIQTKTRLFELVRVYSVLCLSMKKTKMTNNIQEYV